MDAAMSKVQKQQIVSPLYDKGRKLNRRLKREAAKIDRAAEQWRSEEVITSKPILLNVNNVNMLMPRTLAYNLLASREAKIVADLDARVDMIAEGAD
jgi:hypothetical protein